jgi:Glyoxalase-like domain
MATGVQVVFDCADPGRLADFWAGALGYTRQDPPSGYASWEELGQYWVVMQDPEGNEFCVH